MQEFPASPKSPSTLLLEKCPVLDGNPPGTHKISVTENGVPAGPSLEPGIVEVEGEVDDGAGLKDIAKYLSSRLLSFSLSPLHIHFKI